MDWSIGTMGIQKNPTNGMATAFALAAEAAPKPGDLFGTPAGSAPAPRTGTVGRPAGAHNRRTEQYAQLLIAMHGDPLERGVKVAAIDIMQPGALQQLAKALGVNSKEALAFYKDTRAQVLPYLHQQQARALVLQPGAPRNPVDAADVFRGSVVLDAIATEVAIDDGEAP